MLSPDQHCTLRFFNPLSPKGSQIPRPPTTPPPPPQKPTWSPIKVREMVTSRSDPVSCTTSLGWVLVARPAGGECWGWCSGRRHQDSSWTVRGGRSECRAADVVRLPLMPCGAAPATGLTKQMQIYTKIKNSSVRLEKSNLPCCWI